MCTLLKIAHSKRKTMISIHSFIYLFINVFIETNMKCLFCIRYYTKHCKLKKDKALCLGDNKLDTHIDY